MECFIKKIIIKTIKTILRNEVWQNNFDKHTKTLGWLTCLLAKNAFENSIGKSKN